jgi:hypothetical protein
MADQNNPNNNPNPKKPKDSMYKKYTNFATKQDADGGHTNLWINNAAFFAVGVLADAYIFKFGQK